MGSFVSDGSIVLATSGKMYAIGRRVLLPRPLAPQVMAQSTIAAVRSRWQGKNLL